MGAKHAIENQKPIKSLFFKSGTTVWPGKFPFSMIYYEDTIVNGID